MEQNQLLDKKTAKTQIKQLKNVVKIKNKTKKQLNIRDKKNGRRVINCNNKLVKSKVLDKEILSKINELNTNGKKTVVYFIDSFFPIIDGVVNVLDNYATFMTDYFNVVICAPKHNKKTFVSDKYFVLGANSIYIKKQGYDLGFPQFDDEFKKYISILKIDLIHINSPFNMGSFGLELAKKRKIPSITTFHSQFRQDFYKATKSELLSKILSNIIINIYQKSTVTITMNTFSAEIMRKYGLKRKKIEIVPNATSLVYKEFDNNFENEILNKYKINKNYFNFIYIGRFVKVKNIYFIIDSLIKLKEINNKFNFIFLGYGPEEEKMKKIISENGLENNIIFTGKILNEDEKAIIIKNSNLLFFPSYYDTDGIVKIECACYGVPTICLENTGVAAGIIKDETGFVEKDDIDLVVEKLDFLIKNVEFTKKIGNNARKILYITWNDVGNKLKNIYDDLLNTKNLKSTKHKEKKST